VAFCYLVRCNFGGLAMLAAICLAAFGRRAIVKSVTDPQIER
jgi:hypothetical protein